MFIRSLLLVLCIAALLGGCSDAGFNGKLKKALKEDPSILAEAIEANPADFMMAVQKAARNAQEEMAKKRKEEEQKKLTEAYDNPLTPEIRKDETIRGTKGAPIVLVEYSDFECPYCARGFKTVMALLDKYKGKVQFIYKHLPLSFHRNAIITSQYYEALRLQSEALAIKFHDEIYNDQSKLRTGENYLKSVAKKLGANMDKLQKDYKSKAVMDRIDADQKEAAKYDMQGTPGFIINGVPVKGAYPVEHFVQIIDELQKRGKLKL